MYDDFDFNYFGDDMRREVKIMRSKLGKRSRNLDQCSESKVRSQFKKLAKKVNKKAKKGTGEVGVFVTQHGEIIVPESP